MLRQLILSIIVLMLISCASTNWVKPGATQEELEADTVTCDNQIITSRIGARAMMGMGAPTTRGRSRLRLVHGLKPIWSVQNVFRVKAGPGKLGNRIVNRKA